MKKVYLATGWENTEHRLYFKKEKDWNSSLWNCESLWTNNERFLINFVDQNGRISVISHRSN